ncbi:monovalent cation/H+ antiporter complex subunit F [Corynebacterium sp.]|uniref:monovalent cation/H+ antiporter complex subunit F n=1 Tax=Corynebacterium sp. TaxID=1720 RepID=UPI0026DD14FD|nr:monovalent cation/H+ antiporter complex subunit F [Corynebacterium sp.]MDO5077750.1 monovalent cation/H+ antiporter complex subunit F [Corynebacterium sp.]
MTPFELIISACIAVSGLALLANLVLILKVKKMSSRAVLADMVFYTMVATYLLWSLLNRTFITYEVALLAGLLGLITTVSTARILSKGRR